MLAAATACPPFLAIAAFCLDIIAFRLFGKTAIHSQPSGRSDGRAKLASYDRGAGQGEMAAGRVTHLRLLFRYCIGGCGLNRSGENSTTTGRVFCQKGRALHGNP